ncbi:MAG: tryptophan synthase subunit beta [Tabrizicola sp.]|uniref:tryptophan synthase subunit beta n=1 Tax=Tabrizicola sp. TaxID=2005166 RepID=UPI00273717F8|nr:tryptophan synthase subunit beta [Tabrizicola sp.]MDP3262596.1 tryptophan synthase subunit beta [Tabrizicola sp.]MDP3647756.1 tryptophan synthase subunit beta [Paracoccaceae bacterium]MDZ4066218.1 tryptophan synthase subunit beta [Tabrizicola sp.]
MDTKHKRDRRFRRQFDAISRLVPALRGPIKALRGDRLRLLRIPLALLMVAGGVVSFLPFLGIWMLPLGLLLLAVDLAFMRGPVAAAMIRVRSKASILWRRWKHRSDPSV